MFSQVSVILSTGGVHGRGWGCAGQGACVAEGGIHGREGHAWWGCAWQERQPLQRTVRILLEYILVHDDKNSTINKGGKKLRDKNVACGQTLNCENNSIDDSLRFRECGVVLTRRWDVIRTGLLWLMST